VSEHFGEQVEGEVDSSHVVEEGMQQLVGGVVDPSVLLQLNGRSGVLPAGGTGRRSPLCDLPIQSIQWLESPAGRSSWAAVATQAARYSPGPEPPRVERALRWCEATCLDASRGMEKEKEFAACALILSSWLLALPRLRWKNITETGEQS
jgi:hypothetical protein